MRLIPTMISLFLFSDIDFLFFLSYIFLNFVGRWNFFNFGLGCLSNGNKDSIVLKCIVIVTFKLKKLSFVVDDGTVFFLNIRSIFLLWLLLLCRLNFFNVTKSFYI